MAKNRRKYFINERDAIDLFENGYSFTVKKMNWYQLRIRVSDQYEWFDWYHTQGTLCIAGEDWCKRMGSYGDAEEVALAIRKRMGV